MLFRHLAQKFLDLLKLCNCFTFTKNCKAAGNDSLAVFLSIALILDYYTGTAAQNIAGLVAGAPVAEFLKTPYRITGFP